MGAGRGAVRESRAALPAQCVKGLGLAAVFPEMSDRSIFKRSRDALGFGYSPIQITETPYWSRRSSMDPFSSLRILNLMQLKA